MVRMNVDPGAAATGPLAGIKVLDFATVVSGPLCAQILGDMGADVIKVEAPHGDSTRRMGPPFQEGLTPLYVHCNRNKRSVVLDLKSEEDRSAARRLARDTDVIVQNYRPGVAERIGIGYAELAAENPGLVYVAINGFGPEGPYADQPAYDMLIQALSGLAHDLGEKGRPKLVRNLMADKTSALTAAYATLGALFARERDPEGRGQLVEVPMIDAYAAFGLVDALPWHTFLPGGEIPPDELSEGLYRAWPTRDGHVAVVLVEDHQFEGFCRAVEREDMIGDPRCANLMARIQSAPTLFEMTGEAIARYTTAEILERARKFEVPMAPVHDREGFLEDPQVAHNATHFEIEDPTVGPVRLLRSPVRYARTPTSLRRHPPKLGQHDEEILT